MTVLHLIHPWLKEVSIFDLDNKIQMLFNQNRSFVSVFEEKVVKPMIDLDP